MVVVVVVVVGLAFGVAVVHQTYKKSALTSIFSSNGVRAGEGTNPAVTGTEGTPGEGEDQPLS